MKEQQCFSSLKKSEETTFQFTQCVEKIYKKWKLKRLQTYKVMLIINLQNLRQENGMLSMIKITQTMVKEMKMVQPLNETKVIKSSFYDYSDAYILVTGNIAAAYGNPDTRVALRNCAPFTKYITHINDEDVDGNREIKMYMYNLIEYSDNY